MGDIWSRPCGSQRSSEIGGLNTLYSNTSCSCTLFTHLFILPIQKPLHTSFTHILLTPPPFNHPIHPPFTLSTHPIHFHSIYASPYSPYPSYVALSTHSIHLPHLIPPIHLTPYSFRSANCCRWKAPRRTNPSNTYTRFSTVLWSDSLKLRWGTLMKQFRWRCCMCWEICSPRYKPWT